MYYTFFFQPEWTSRDLFYQIYGKKLLDDYENDRLDEDGNPLEPSEEENLTPDVALSRARQTGSDAFEGCFERSREWKTRRDQT